MDIIQEFLSKINSKRILVIAGSIREFETFIQEIMDYDFFEQTQEPERFPFRVDPELEGVEFCYYTETNKMRGMMFDKYLYYGTGAERTDVDIDLIRMSIK